MMKFVYEQSVTRADALREMRERWEPAPRSRVVGLSDACGRVTSEEVRALHSLPVKRSSKRDGIAVRSADFAAGAPDTSSWTRDVDFAQADTGDDFPDAFDAVIAVEHIAYDEHGGLRIVEVPPDLQSGSGVNPCGSIVRAGDVLVAAHTRLTPELVASLAVGGHAQVRVLERPRVAFSPTGSELVPFGAYPQRGQNIEANSLLVSGMVRAWGAEVTCYPVVRDDEEALEAALDRALEAADIVLINGGSSRGEEDFNARLLERRGSYFRHGVRAVPGRPVGAPSSTCPVRCWRPSSPSIGSSAGSSRNFWAFPCRAGAPFARGSASRSQSPRRSSGSCACRFPATQRGDTCARRCRSR